MAKPWLAGISPAATAFFCADTCRQKFRKTANAAQIVYHTEYHKNADMKSMHYN